MDKINVEAFSNLPSYNKVQKKSMLFFESVSAHQICVGDEEEGTIDKHVNATSEIKKHS